MWQVLILTSCSAGSRQSSADVETGWLRLQYEVQYRKVEVEQWQRVGTRLFWERKHQHLDSLFKTAVFIFSPQADLVKSTYRTLYGLQTNVEYEVRVRCRTLTGKAFGDFSDSVFVHILSKGKDSADRLTMTACVVDDVSMCVSFHSHTFQLWPCSYLELCVWWPFCCWWLFYSRKSTSFQFLPSLKTRILNNKMLQSVCWV